MSVKVQDLIVAVLLGGLVLLFLFMTYMMAWGLDEKLPPWRRWRNRG